MNGQEKARFLFCAYSLSGTARHWELTRCYDFVARVLNRTQRFNKILTHYRETQFPLDAVFTSHRCPLKLYRRLFELYVSFIEHFKWAFSSAMRWRSHIAICEGLYVWVFEVVMRQGGCEVVVEVELASSDQLCENLIAV